MFIMCRYFTKPALEYGKKYEAIARSKYEELHGVQVKLTGLTMMSAHPYIAASADGMVGSTVIEIKCPYSGRDKTIVELVEGGYSHIYKDNGIWKINKASHYYYQVQGEMAIKQCTMCHFIVWTIKDIVVIPIELDTELWDQALLPKLVSYFNDTVKPKLVTASHTKTS